MKKKGKHRASTYQQRQWKGIVQDLEEKDIYFRRILGDIVKKSYTREDQKDCKLDRTAWHPGQHWAA